jgi:hypothetical protein
MLCLVLNAGLIQGWITTSSRHSRSSLSMVLEKPKTLAKIESLKIASDHLIHPLKEVSSVYVHKQQRQPK